MEYSVKRSGKPSDAVISQGGKRVATLSGEGDLLFRVVSVTVGSWTLNPRVQGEVWPFTMRVTA